jgi:hypothetical protein
MEPNPTTPEPPGRPSSVTRASAPADSAVAKALPPVDSTDDSPTIISLNRPRANSAEVADGLRGKKLAHFELIEPIGVGGMAAVIRANDLQLGRVVALKILPPEMAADPENISRFKQEARAAAKLDHENVARVYFCGEDQGLHFIAFEYVKGTDLRSLMASGGPLSPATAVKYMLQVATGLAHAASRGVVHRDIKPSNIIVTPEGRAKIVDMGLARSADGGVTQSGVTLGTFDYISPEQAIEPRNADVRSDLYSLGCTFYHLLTGQPPVPDGTAAKKLHHHQHVPPVDPRELNPAIPDELVGVLGKMMAKEPRDRYQRPEQLIQHLLVIANKMQLPADSSSQEAMLFVDAPLPQPPRFSPVLAAVAAVAAVAILAVILGTGGRDPRPLPIAAGTRPNDAPVVPPGNGGAPPTLPENPAERGPKTAANARELARLLEDPAVEEIQLTGDEYVLDEIAPIDGIPMLAANRSVRLVGKPRGKVRATLRWKTDMAPVHDPDAPPAILYVKAMSPAVQVKLENLTFAAPLVSGDGTIYAVAATGAGRLTLINCEFAPGGKPNQTAGVRFEAPTAPASEVELQQCHFAAGSTAVDVIGRAAVRAKQCSFSPQEVVFRFAEKGVPAEPKPDRLLAELDHCSVMMKGEGAVFQAERNVWGTIKAGNCLFARAGERGDVALIRETEPRESETPAPVHFTAPENARNVYYGLACWAMPTRQATTPEDCQKFDLPFGDRAAVFQTNGPPPWAAAQPLDATDAKEAFALKTDRPELRSAARPAQMVGVQKGALGSLYPPLAALADAAPEGSANVVVVDPAAIDDDKRARRFRSFATALQGRTGDVTVLIRHNGKLEIEPVALAGRNLRLTVKPDEGFRPLLALKTDVDAFNPALFSLHNGAVSFKDLRFELRPSPSDDSKWVSVVSVSGAGQVSFEDCAATLDNPVPSDDTQPVLVTLTTDPDNMAGTSERLPRVRLANCVVRGRGHVVAVRGSRALELEADNVLAVLRGSFLAVTGQSKDPPLAAHAQLTLKRLTTYLTDAFLDLRGPEGDRKVAGLVPTDVKCEDCLIVAAGDKPVVYAERVDRDTLVKTLLTWEAGGRGNIYGNFQKHLEVKAGGTMMVMPTDWTARDWRDFSHENEGSFARVMFKSTPADDSMYPSAGYVNAAPKSFKPKLTDMNMQRADMSATLGADVDALQKMVE